MIGPALPVYLCVVAGLGALALHGGALIIAVVMAAVVAAVPARWREASVDAPWPLVTVGVVLGLCGMVAIGLDAQQAVALGVIYLAAQRRLARVSGRDDRVSLVLSALMFALGATRTDSVWFAPLLAVWALVLPVALVRIDEELTLGSRPRRRDALSRVPVLRLVAMPVVVLALVLFVLLPRLRTARPLSTASSVIDLPLLDGTTVTGVSPDSARPGDMAELLPDPSVAFRAWFSQSLVGPVYFRVVAFDRWDGAAWSRGESEGYIEAEQDVSPEALHVEVAQVNVEGGLLLTTGSVHSLRMVGESTSLFPDSDGNVLVQVDGSARYHVWTSPPLGPGGIVAPDRGPDPRWTDFPELDPEVMNLVERITAGKTDNRAKVEAIADYLRQNHAYTRVPGETADQPLTWFLFDGKRGHCEYFATAMTLMARAAGVPARYVSGYVDGETNAAGYRVFRMSHAHAWVEVLIKDEGWVVVDATPSGPLAPPTEVGAIDELTDALASWWYRTLLGYDVAAQSGIVVRAAEGVESLLPNVSVKGSAPWLGLLGVLIIGIGLVSGLRTLLSRLAARLAGEVVAKPRPTGAVARAHLDARSALSELGWTVPPALPPVAAAKWVRERESGEAAEALEQLAWLHYQVRYGDADDSELGGQARELASKVSEIGAPPF